MQTIGERLEEARKKRGVSIREAAEATKIRGEYLSRFERNQFDIDLTDLYVRGFLRTYAQYLRVPEDRIMSDFAALGRGGRQRTVSREVYGRMEVAIAEEPAAEAPAAGTDEPLPPQAPPPRSLPPRRPGAPSRSGLDPVVAFRLAKWLLGSVGVLLVIWGAQALLSDGAAPPRPRSERPAAAPAVSAPSEPTITVIALDAVRLNVKVKNPDGSAGEALIPDVTMARGERRTISKKTALYLTATALENVALEENGRTMNIRDQGIRGYDRVQIAR